MLNKTHLIHQLKWLFAIALSIIALGMITLGILWHIYFCEPVINQQDFTYLILPGTSTKTIAHTLYQQSNRMHPLLFRLYLKLHEKDHQLKAGEYLFKKGSTIASIANQLAEGNVIQHPFTIVDGWTFQKTLQELMAAPAIKHSLDQSSIKTIAEELTIPKENFEGLLLPETYYYTYGKTDIALLKRAYQAMQDYLKSQWGLRDENLPYKNPYQALIMASIIEKETGLESERPLIAAVFIARFKKGIKLQSDPTVIYALGDRFKDKLTKKNLQFLSPYNTYLNYGLPPTPIALPSKQAVDAALHPAKTDALYFVAKNDGSHEFSATLKQHKAAILKYQLTSEKENDRNV